MPLDRLSAVPIGIRYGNWPVPNTALQLHLNQPALWSDYSRPYTLKWLAAMFDLLIIHVLKDAIDLCHSFATSDCSVIGER
jgi:hypothetical protein